MKDNKVFLEEETELTDREMKIYEQGFSDGEESQFWEMTWYVIIGLVVSGILVIIFIK